MSLSPPKAPLTVRLDDELFRAVKQHAARTGASLGSVVADAARQTLLPQYRQQKDAAVLRAVEKCFNRLVKMDEQRRDEHELIREMLAMLVRTYYTHTPAISGDTLDAAHVAGAQRFERFLRVLGENLRKHASIMEPQPPQLPNAESPVSERTANNAY